MQWQQLWILTFMGEPFQVKESVNYVPNALFHPSQSSLSSTPENMTERATLSWNRLLSLSTSLWN